MLKDQEFNERELKLQKEWSYLVSGCYALTLTYLVAGCLAFFFNNTTAAAACLGCAVGVACISHYAVKKKTFVDQRVKARIASQLSSTNKH